MIPRIAWTAILLSALATPANADKFHFGTDEENKKTEGNAVGRVIEGVLLKQDDDTYTIRIVGGEITVDKSTVTRIEKDTLTVQNIETMESGQRVRVAEADDERRRIQAAEASARREAQDRARIRAVPTEEKTMVIEIDFQDLLPGYTFRTYDPVLHRANLSGLRQMIEDFLRAEILKAAHR